MANISILVKKANLDIQDKLDEFLEPIGEWHEEEETGNMLFIPDTEVIGWDFELFTSEENMLIAEFVNFSLTSENLQESSDSFWSIEMLANAR